MHEKGCANDCSFHFVGVASNIGLMFPLAAFTGAPLMEVV